eukprot:Nitzschia sp. Nitz4//scaffold11_size288233//107991//108722//NITZ4_000763-RA/size288233-processed-gene-0.157-mRNA-1//1//CDS//3329534041//5444//frame0
MRQLVSRLPSHVSGSLSVNSAGVFARGFSTEMRQNEDSLPFIQRQYVARRVKGTGGSREYLLLPPNTAVKDAKRDESLIAATLFSHRNIVFGARSCKEEYSILDLCPPLLTMAIRDAGIDGEQPQALASLAGLNQWVKDSLQSRVSSELEILRSSDPTGFDAVQSIATGIPRPGQERIGLGTFQDAEKGWKKIAAEFVELGLSQEASLYQKEGARLVAIEHLADKNPKYLASAGGAMARLFFV